jgi:hypothetical protein
MHGLRSVLGIGGAWCPEACPRENVEIQVSEKAANASKFNGYRKIVDTFCV